MQRGWQHKQRMKHAYASDENGILDRHGKIELVIFLQGLTGRYGCDSVHAAVLVAAQAYSCQQV